VISHQEPWLQKSVAGESVAGESASSRLILGPLTSPIFSHDLTRPIASKSFLTF
jgi:hypothetical protein